MIERERFFNHGWRSGTKHHLTSLSYAVAMIGASMSDAYAHLKPLCYSGARNYLERAERKEDGGHFFSIEALQSLLLVVWYEFSEADLSRAWMSLGRAIRLMKLLELDRIDAGDSRAGASGFRVSLPTPENPVENEEKRRTFWVVFILDCHVAMKMNYPVTFRQLEVSPYISNTCSHRMHRIFANDLG